MGSELENIKNKLGGGRGDNSPQGGRSRARSPPGVGQGRRDGSPATQNSETGNSFMTKKKVNFANIASDNLLR